MITFETNADCLADRGIEASAPASRGDRVPQRDAPRFQRRESGLVAQPHEVDPDRLAHQMPEAVLRMRVVAPRRERGLARQAAEDQDPGVGCGNRGEGGLARQNALPSPMWPVAVVTNSSVSSITPRPSW